MGGRRRKTSARRVVGTTCAPRGLDTSVLWVDSLSIFKTWSNFRKRGRKNPKRTKRETTAGSHTHTQKPLKDSLRFAKQQVYREKP